MEIDLQGSATVEDKEQMKQLCSLYTKIVQCEAIKVGFVERFLEINTARLILFIIESHLLKKDSIVWIKLLLCFFSQYM